MAIQQIRRTGLVVKERTKLGISKEMHAHYAMRWLAKMMEDVWPLRFILGEIFLHDDMAAQFLISEHNFGKSWRVNLQSFLTSVILVSDDFKLRLGKLASFIFIAKTMINSFGELMAAFHLDKREPHLNILNFNVQLFTVPSVAKQAVASFKALETILGVLVADPPTHQKPQIHAFSLLDHLLTFKHENVGLDQIRPWITVLRSLEFKQFQIRIPESEDHVYREDFGWVKSISWMQRCHELSVKMVAQIDNPLQRVALCNEAFSLLTPIDNRNAVCFELPLIDFLRLAIPPVILHPDLHLPSHLLQSMLNLLFTLADIRGGLWVRNGMQVEGACRAFTSRAMNYRLYSVLAMIKLCLVRGQSCPPMELGDRTEVSWLVKMAHALIMEPVFAAVDEAYIQEQLALYLPVVKATDFGQLKNELLPSDLANHESIDRVLSEICTISKTGQGLTLKLRSDAIQVNPFHSGYDSGEMERANGHPHKTSNPLYLTPLAKAEFDAMLPHLDTQYLGGLLEVAYEQVKMSENLDRLLMIAAHLGLPIPQRLANSSSIATQLYRLSNPLHSSVSMTVSLNDEEVERKAKKREAALAAIRAQQLQFTAAHLAEMEDISIAGPVEEKICILCKEALLEEPQNYGYLVMTGIEQLGCDLDFERSRNIVRRELNRVLIGSDTFERLCSCFHLAHLKCAKEFKGVGCPLCRMPFNAVACPTIGYKPQIEQLSVGTIILMNTLEDCLDYLSPESNEMRKMLELIGTRPQLKYASKSNDHRRYELADEGDDVYSRRCPFSMERSPCLLFTAYLSTIDLTPRYAMHVKMYPDDLAEAAANRWIRLTGTILILRRTDLIKCDWQTWLSMSDEQRRQVLKLPAWSEAMKIRFEHDSKVARVANPSAVGFLPLPESYDQLYRQFWQSPCCFKHGLKPPVPCLCLFCHQVMCLDLNHFAKHECGGVVKLFLIIPTAQLIVAYRPYCRARNAHSRAIITRPGPYVDRFGESELNGGDLRLDKQLLAEYYRLWTTFEWMSLIARAP